MKIIIFAGGQGKRLWPLSRKKTPKQFQKIFGDQTTLENSFNTINKKFKAEDIFISTGAEFSEEVFKTIPNLPKENLIVEPEARDTAAAVAYAMLRISQKFPNEPVVIRWQNSLIKNPGIFMDALDEADKLFKKGKTELVYIAVPSKFPNTGVGHIKLGKEIAKLKNSMKIMEFAGFKEKPNNEMAQIYHTSGEYAWNPGCYITTPQFMLRKFFEFSPELFKHIQIIKDHLGTENEWSVIKEEFSKFEKVSIDYALWEKLPFDGIKVLLADYDWHYVSTWTDLKKALLSGTNEKNLTKGNVKLLNSEDCLVYNFDKDKFIALVGVSGIEVIDTGDALLICDSKSAGMVKNLVDELGNSEDTKQYC